MTQDIGTSSSTRCAWRRACAALLMLATLVAFAPRAEAGADPYVFESAAPGNAGGGLAISATFASGYTFRLLQRTAVSEVGVQATLSAQQPQTIYAALYRVNTPWTIPDVANETDLIGATTLQVTSTAPTDVSAALAATLEPGWYTIAFGTGRHGATAGNFAVTLNDTGTTSAPYTLGPYSVNVGSNARTLQGVTLRCFVRGQTLPAAPPPPDVFLMQTALPNAWWSQQAYSIDNDFFRGARFNVTDTVRARRASAWMIYGSGTVFAAIVRLSGPDANPPLVGTPAFAQSVVGSTLIAAGAAADEYAGDFGDLELTPGSYALIFGSGLFGATGSAQLMAVQDQLVTADSLIWIGPGSFWSQSSSPTFRMALSGVVPEIDVTPKPVAFGAVSVGTSAPQVMTVHNLRDGDLHLAGIALAGTDAAQFALDADVAACANATLPAQGTCTFTLRYVPNAAGAHAARVEIASDGVPSPLSVDVTGTGVPVHTVTPSAGPHGSIAPDTPQSVPDGAAVSFVLTPDAGYHIAGADSGCGGTLAGDTFTTAAISADCAVAASFTIDAPSTLVALDGTPQSTSVGNAFAQGLRVRVANSAGIGVPGVEVSFAAPANGASAIVPATTLTDDDGIATVSASANAVAGSYVVQASVAGVPAAAAFALTNLAGAPAHVQTVGGNAQSTVVGTAFTEPLVAKVTDANGNALPAVHVAFAPPATAAGATLSSRDVTTDADGLARVTASANAAVGGYAVVASVAGVGEIASFALENRAPDVALSVTVDAGQAYVRYGQMLDVHIVVSNAGAAAATDVAVTANLPAQLDASAASWICLDAGGGACAAAGSGTLDDRATVPAHGSVHYLLSAPVLAAAPGADVAIAATTDGPYAGYAASGAATSVLVLFRDDFENSADVTAWLADTLDLDAMVRLRWAGTPASGGGVETLLDARAADGSGFRIERVGGSAARLRLHAFAADGIEWATRWSAPTTGAPTLLAFAHGETPTLLLGGATPDLEIALATSARNWQVRLREGMRIEH